MMLPVTWPDWAITSAVIEVIDTSRPTTADPVFMAHPFHLDKGNTRNPFRREIAIDPPTP
jgi:hypothetical protein